MARTDDDTWDLASSVGATATMVAAARAMASKAEHPADQRPVRRAAGSGGGSGPVHPAGQRRADPCRPRGRQRRCAGGRAADDRQHGGPHQVLRRVLHRRDQRGHPAGGDPGVRAGRPRLPAALARRHRRLRDRPAAGDRVQVAHAGRAGRPAHRRPAHGRHRSARRLAGRAARGGVRPRPAQRVERRGPAGLPAARRAGPLCWTTSPRSARRAAGSPPRAGPPANPATRSGSRNACGPSPSAGANTVSTST